MNTIADAISESIPRALLRKPSKPAISLVREATIVMAAMLADAAKVNMTLEAVEQYSEFRSLGWSIQKCVFLTREALELPISGE